MDKILIFNQFSLDIKSNGHTVPILQQIDLEIIRGKITGLIGSSGSGKTMLLRSCMGLFEDIDNKHTSGSIQFCFDEKHLDVVPVDWHVIYKLRRESIAFILQQSSQVLNPSEHIHTILAKAMSTAGMEVDDAIIIETLLKVGFKQAKIILSRYPHQLSGGQIQRILIAAAILRKASVMLVDEPTSSLDEALKQEILSLLSQINREMGTTMILVSHDIRLAGPYCDQLVVIKKGRIVEQGSADTILNHPKDTYTKSLLQEKPQRGNHDIDLKDLIFEMKAVDKAYGKKRGLFGDKAQTIVLKDFSMKLYRSEILGIAGPSGSGKSSLAKIMAALDQPSSGELYFKSAKFSDFTREDYTIFQRKVKIIFQDPLGSLPPHMTAYDIMKEVAKLYGKDSSEEQMAAYLESFDLDAGILNSRPSKMSGGQRQRLLIARALLSEPEILICDEILSSLDAVVKIQITSLLEKLNREHGLSIVFITHDETYLNGFCDRIISLPARFNESVK